MKIRKPKPIVRWAGGKSRLVKDLLPLVPEHICYVEVFGGGAALLCAKERSSTEVYNDTHGDLVNLFIQVKYHSDELNRELEMVLNSRETFGDFLEQPGFTEIQRAARFFMVNGLSFGGMGINFGSTKSDSGGAANASRAGRMEKIEAMSKRLDKVCIERLDWRECLAKYDGPGTFFFCDPPYIDAKETNYAGWTPEEMAELRDALVGLKGRWLLTAGDSVASRDVFRGFRIREVERQTGIENRPGKVRNAGYHELIIRKHE